MMTLMMVVKKASICGLKRIFMIMRRTKMMMMSEYGKGGEDDENENVDENDDDYEKGEKAVWRE